MRLSLTRTEDSFECIMIRLDSRYWHVAGGGERLVLAYMSASRLLVKAAVLGGYRLAIKLARWGGDR